MTRELEQVGSSPPDVVARDQHRIVAGHDGCDDRGGEDRVPMIAAEIQQRDEALTAQGHDPECAAFDDRDCSCGIAMSGPQVDTRPLRKAKPIARQLDELIDTHNNTPRVVLEGDHARAYRRWTDAMRVLGEAKTAYAAAGVNAQAAHEELARLSVGAAP